MYSMNLREKWEMLVIHAKGCVVFESKRKIVLSFSCNGLSEIRSRTYEVNEEIVMRGKNKIWDGIRSCANFERSVVSFPGIPE